VAIITICLFSGYRIGNFYHGYQVKTLFEQKQRLEQLYQEQNSNIRRIHTLEVELEVERLANADSLIALKKVEKSHYQIKRELAFYEKVMAPEKQADGLTIDNTIVFATESPHHYRFQVVLIQQRLKKRYAKGYVELALVGSLNNKPRTLLLSDISSLTKKELSFSFQYFQHINGEFTLPDNFKPEYINVTAVLPKSKWQKHYRITENTPWPLTTQLVSKEVSLENKG
jgi:predicted RND superfamily exporter protein